MSNPGPPIFDFNRLKPVTMTIIASYDVQELNLAAIFAFLPVTNQNLPSHVNFQKKQGKIRLPPDLNKPGEIFSMRYDKQVRGIIRSEKAKSFSHSIIIDIGTSERIISVKLSRTLELTGPTSFEIAREAAEAVLNHVRKCQENLDYLRNNREIALSLKAKFISGGQEPTDDLGKKIWSLFKEQTKGYSQDKISHFLDFMLNFNRNLYTGTLRLGEFECEMANILFNLGYPINQVTFAQTMTQPPFSCNFINAKSASAVNVYYNYIKFDRNTGQPKQAKHTIRVNKSGHVRHSGPNLEAMKPVYYAFMQRVLLYHNEIQSIESHGKQQLRIVGPGKSISVKEWKELLKGESDLRQKVIQGEVPIATGQDSEGPERTKPKMIIEIQEPVISLEIIENALYGASSSKAMNVVSSESELPSLQFNYAPLLC